MFVFSDVKEKKKEPNFFALVCNVDKSNTNTTVGVCDIHSSVSCSEPWGPQEKKQKKNRWPKNKLNLSTT